MYENDEDRDEECYSYTDEYSGLTVYADDEWAAKRITLSRIAFARAELTTADASPERKAFARKILQDAQEQYPDQVNAALRVIEDPNFLDLFSMDKPR